MAGSGDSVYRAVILTALPVEYLAVRAHLIDPKEEVHPQGTIYERGVFTPSHATWEVGIVEIGAGNTGAAQEAERAINHFKPDVALFVGVAGGIKDVGLGDVVAATKIYGYGSGKARETFEPRPDVGESGYRLEQRARAEARSGNWVGRIKADSLRSTPRAWVAPIAAGEVVIGSQAADILRFLRTQYGDSVAVEMEGRGFLKATRANPGVQAIVIRGISDLIEKKHEADAAGWQEIASCNASAFAYELLAKLSEKDLGPIGRSRDEIPPAIPVPETARQRSREEARATSAGCEWLSLPSQNLFFHGRGDVLEAIDRVLAEQPRAALWGLPGVGKTQIALQYAHTKFGQYKQIFWVVAHSRDALALGLLPVARQLGLPLEADADQGSIIAAFRGWLDGHEDWLLVLDNVEDVGTASEVFPTRAMGRILMTTLEPAVGALAHPIAVEKLAPQDGAHFLLVRAKRLKPQDPLEAALPEDREAALAIARELDGLCLALDQAGAFIEEMSSSPVEYLGLYRSSGKELRRLRGDMSAKDHASVAITFSLALAKVEAQDTAAIDLLRLCAFLSPDAIPEEILHAAADYLGETLKAACSCPLTLLATIRAATRFSLLRRDPTKRTVSIHRLVQEVIRDSMAAEAQEEWAIRAVSAAFIGFAEAKAPAWELHERLVPQAMACLDHIETFEMKFCMAGKLLAQAGMTLANVGDYANSELLLGRAVSIEKDLAVYYRLADACYRQGKFTEAEKHLKHALEVVDPESHQDCACWPRSRNLLAKAMNEQGRYCEAELLAEEALRDSEARFGPDHRKTADYLFNLADLQARRLREIDERQGYIDYG